MSLYEKNSDSSNLDKAIEQFSRAVRCTTYKPYLPSRHGLLAKCLEQRFERTGDMEDLNLAIELEEEALKIAPHHLGVTSTILNNLGVSLCRRFERSSHIQDIDASIRRLMESVDLTPSGHPALFGRHMNWGNSLLARFERLRQIEDLNQAIKLHQSVVATTPSGDAKQASRLSNLANSFLRRFELLGEEQDLLAATKHNQESLTIPLTSDLDRVSILINLAACLSYSPSASGADLGLVISMMQETLLCHSYDEVIQANLLSQIGDAHYSRFVVHESSDDLNIAITYQQKAVDLTPTGPALSLRLNGLGCSLRRRYDLNRSIDDYVLAVKAFRSSAMSSVGFPIDRMRGALLWAWETHQVKEFYFASAAYAQAIHLLPQIAWVGLSSIEQLEGMDSFRSIGRDAAACWFSLAQLNPDHQQISIGRAVEALDHTRSVMWSQASNFRQEAAVLRGVDSTLAENLEKIGRAIWQFCFRNGSSPISEAEKQFHRRSAEEWDTLVARVRQLKGFEDFLRPQPISKLRAAAVDGPIVLINISRFRTDAVIVPPVGDMILVPISAEHPSSPTLQDFSDLQAELDSANWRLGQPLENSHYTSKAEHLQHVSWSLFGKPIIKRLMEIGLVNPNPGNPPTQRVWWCLTGATNFFPIHASHPSPSVTGEQSLGMLDLVVSSYTPTLSVLLRSQKRSPSPFHLLAVGQKDKRGSRPLAWVEAEMKFIKSLTSVQEVTLIEGSSATVEAVSLAMPASSWLHFACHGIQDPVRPLDSGILLHSDQRLTLLQMAEYYNRSGELAYLSSCESATGSKELPDEALHLAAGLQFIGFRSVIGTMWSVDDNDAFDVTRQVYSALLKDGVAQAKASDSALALNLAVRHLRDVQRAPPHRWIPYVHFGL